MKYTEYGLEISLNELKEILEKAELDHERRNMEGCVYITCGDRPKIKQYCSYAECNATDFTYLAR